MFINKVKYNFKSVFYINIVVFDNKKPHFINYLIHKIDFFNFY